jgi:exodeoxyribonuclease VII small subunit
MNGQKNLEIDTLSYEVAFSLLEETIAELESGERKLEESIQLYERGQALLKRCSSLLDQAELKIKLLSGDKVTEFERENLD